MECPNEENKHTLLRSLAVIAARRHIGIQVADWNPETHLSWRLLEKGYGTLYHTFPLQETDTQNGCLIASLKNLDISISDIRDVGPFSAAWFNNHQLISSTQSSEYLRCLNRNLTFICNGMKLICHQAVAENHVFGLLVEDNMVAIYDSRVHYKISWRLSDFLDVVKEFENLTFLEVTKHCPTSSDGPYQLLGSAGGDPEERKVLSTYLIQCDCGGSLKPVNCKIVDADVYGFNGIQKVKHQAKRCLRKTCGAYHWYNYRWKNKQKICNVTLERIECLFVSDKIAFDLKFSEYHEELHFRGFLSTMSICYAVSTCLVNMLPINERNWRLYYTTARFLRLAMVEMSQETLCIGNNSVFKFTEEQIARYDAKVHCADFRNSVDVNNVLKMAGDGHEKVCMVVRYI